MKRIFLLFLFLFPIGIFAQRAVVGLPKMNMVYIGLENPIEVAVDGVNPKDIVVKINGGELKGENGKYVFVPDGSVHRVQLTVGVKKKHKINWIDSAEYSTQLADHITLFGTRNGGSISYGELMVVQHIQGDMGCGFAGCDPACYHITYYEITAINENIIYTEKVKSNKITAEAKNIFSQFKDGGFIYINKIEAKWCGKHKIVDTIISLEPIMLKVRGNKFPEEMYLVRGLTKQKSKKTKFVHVLNLNNPDFKIPFSIGAKDSTWTISNANNNTLISEVSYSTDTIIQAKTFFTNGKIKSKTNYNYKDLTSSYIAFHENGSKSTQASALILYDQIITLDNLQLISEKEKTPGYESPLLIGEIKSYYENGKLEYVGNYDTATVYELLTIQNPKTPDDPYNTLEEAIPFKYSVRHGLWKFYDENGNLIRQTIYDKGRVKE